MEWIKTLKKSFIFSIDPKRWLQVFALDAFFILLLSLAVLANLKSGISIYSAGALILEAIVIVIGYSLAKIWVNGAIIYQSYKEKERIKRAYELAKSKYLSLLGAVIIAAIVGLVVSLIPYIGFIFAILFSLIFFFIYQGVIIRNLKFDETLQHSYNIFKNSWASVIGIYLVLTLISGLIILLFSIPLILFVYHYLLTLKSIEGVINVIKSNLLTLIIVGIIVLVGASISQVFNLKAITEFYLQLTKARESKKSSRLTKRRVKK